MCVIIDTNKLSVFFNGADEASAALLKWVFRSSSIVFATQGKVAKEIKAARKMTAFLELKRQHKAHAYTRHDLSQHEEKLKDNKHCSSDDVHVLALALASGARVLYSGDKNLHKDFKNSAIIPNPPGKVYSSKDHTHLLNKKACKPRK